MITDEARQVHGAALVADLHCDLLLTDYFLGWDWGREHGANPLPGAALMGHCDIPRMRAGGLGFVALGLVINPLRRGSAPSAVRGDLARMARAVAAHPDDLVIATTAAQIRAARAAGRIAVFGGLEGAHGLNGSVDALPQLQRAGLGYVGLAHFSSNPACRPMVGWGANDRDGLRDFGRELVDALGALRLLVDVAHVNKPGVLEACARSRAPVICSHTACTAVHPSPRGLDDEQLRAVADTGGVIGVIFAPPFIGPGGIDAVVRHLDHIRATVGVEHCAIGSDWEGWVTYPRALDGADKLPALTQALLAHGWRADEVQAALGENFLRVLEQVRGV